MSDDEAPPRYAIQIILTETAARPLYNWAHAAEGASVPTTGWHITLIPAFSLQGADAGLAELLQAVADRHAPFELELSEIEATTDSTRSGYHAVFLGCGPDAEDLCLPLFALQAELAETLAPLRSNLQPELSDRPFRPHITLALSVSEQEAARLAAFGRKQQLRVRFEVASFWLLRSSETEEGEVRTERQQFVLAGADAAGQAAPDSLP